MYVITINIQWGRAIQNITILLKNLIYTVYYEFT